MLKMDDLEGNQKKIKEILEHDTLFEVIEDTPLEEELYSDEYLSEIIEKKYYSTPEIAKWFGINDGQLRYYIKPFHDYLFEPGENTPTSSTAYRLNFKSILKLRMIMLLKDEYRVKGLKRLLGLDGNGYIEKKPSININPSTDLTTPVNPNEPSEELEELQQQVEGLNRLVEQIVSTGLFEMKQNEDGVKLELREDIAKLSSRINALETQQQTVLEGPKKNQAKDIATQVTEKRIEWDLAAKARSEALEKWNETHKYGVLAKLFQSEKIDQEKSEFITKYVNDYLNEHLSNALQEYHNKQDSQNKSQNIDSNAKS